MIANVFWEYTSVPNAPTYQQSTSIMDRIIIFKAMGLGIGIFFNDKSSDLVDCQKTPLMKLDEIFRPR